MNEKDEIVNDFYKVIHRTHQCKPKLRGKGDLTNVEFIMLLMLSDKLEREQKEGISLNEIVALSGMSMSAASKKVTIFENKGYVTRKVSVEDRRKTLISPTPKGREICNRDREQKHRMVIELVERMGIDHMRQLLDLANEAFDYLEQIERSQDDVYYEDEAKQSVNTE